MDLGQSSGSAQARRHHLDALSEDLPQTAGRVASEATQAQVQLGGTTLPRQIAEPAAIVAVNPARRVLASRADSGRRLGPRLDDQPVGLDAGALDDQIAGQERRQGLERHSILEVEAMAP